MRVKQFSEKKLEVTVKMNANSFLLRVTRMVRSSMIRPNCKLVYRRISGVPQKGGNNEQRSTYLNYSWWKKRQAQRDKYYTSTEKEYEDHASALNEYKDANPIDESKMEMPNTAFTYDQDRQGFGLKNENESIFYSKSLDPMSTHDRYSDTNKSDGSKMAVWILGAVPIVAILMYWNR